MSSDRSLYDKQSYLHKTDEASKPLEYILDINRQESCMICSNKPNVLPLDKIIENETELLGHNRKLSRNPKDKYQKNSPQKLIVGEHTVPYVCERNLYNPKFRGKEDNYLKYVQELKGKNNVPKN